MQVKVKDNKLTITLDIHEPQLSGSGKTLLVASDRVKTGVNGVDTTIAVNAYVKNPDYNKG